MPALTIGIIGAGAWGTALACACAEAGNKIILWAHEADVVDAINATHENTVFLPGIKLDRAIEATNDLARAAAHDVILIVTPAQHTRSVVSQLDGIVKNGTLCVMCAKGIERSTGKFMTDVLAETLTNVARAVLSGPSFAADVARGLPTALTLAGEDRDLIVRLAEAIKSPRFRPYLSDDMVGAQIGGAVKNVLAIACGIVEGKKFGDSARAALITRGFAEMVRFGTHLGAKAETLTGLSGLGDLILTCSSRKSRNMSLGIALGGGMTVQRYLADKRSVSEGVYTAGVVVDIARTHDIDMPICNGVHAITADGADIDRTIEDLLNRPVTSEIR